MVTAMDDSILLPIQYDQPTNSSDSCVIGPEKTVSALPETVAVLLMCASFMDDNM